MAGNKIKPFGSRSPVRSACLFWILVGVASALSAGVTGATETDHTAVSYAYAGRGMIRGSLDGNCLAHGAILAPDQVIDFRMGPGSAERVTIWANKTAIHPDEPEEGRVSTPYDYTRGVAEHSLPSGEYKILGRSGGYVALLPPKGYTEPALMLTFSGSDATWTSIREPFRSAAYLREVPDSVVARVLMNGLETHDGRFPDRTRGLSFGNSTIALTGDAMLHLRGVDLKTPHGTIRLPDTPQVIQNQTAPGKLARVTTYRLDELFVPLTGLVLDGQDIQGAWGCTDVSGAVNGEMSVSEATGRAVHRNEELAFVGQVLTIRGSFSLAESVQDSGGSRSVRADANGAIQILGIDFQVVALPLDVSDVLVKVGLWGLIAAGVAYTLKKAAPAMTIAILRHREGDVREHPARKAILELIAVNGFTHLKDLPDLLKVSRGQVRHHMDVLLASGLIHRMEFEGQIILYGRNRTSKDLMEQIVRSHERLYAIHHLRQRGFSRAEVVTRICASHEVTPRTARKYIQKYNEMVGQRPRGEDR